jgi:hypothetical protein
MEKTKHLFVEGTYIQIDAKWWKYNQNNCYNVIIIDFACCIKDSHNTILSYDLIIEFIRYNIYKFRI